METPPSRRCFNPPQGSARNPSGEEEFKVSVSYLKPAQKQKLLLGVVAHTCNPSSREAEIEQEFKASGGLQETLTYVSGHSPHTRRGE